MADGWEFVDLSNFDMEGVEEKIRESNPPPIFNSANFSWEDHKYNAIYIFVSSAFFLSKSEEFLNMQTDGTGDQISDWFYEKYQETGPDALVGMAEMVTLSSMQMKSSMEEYNKLNPFDVDARVETKVWLGYMDSQLDKQSIFGHFCALPYVKLLDGWDKLKDAVDWADKINNKMKGEQEGSE